MCPQCAHSAPAVQTLSRCPLPPPPQLLIKSGYKSGGGGYLNVSVSGPLKAEKSWIALEKVLLGAFEPKKMPDV